MSAEAIKRFSGHPIFRETSTHSFLPIERRFGPLDKSLLWKCNDIYWKHWSLWHETYGGHFETSLPAGVSESHRTEFVEHSARRFLASLQRLEKLGKLPERIIVIEQGPGTGHYAEKFLNIVQERAGGGHPYYSRLLFVLSDTSNDTLQAVDLVLAPRHKGHYELFKQRTTGGYPKRYTGQALLVRHGNLWDQMPCRILRMDEFNTFEVKTRAGIEPSIERALKLVPGAPSLHVLIALLARGKFEKIVTKWPTLWKPLMESLKLEVKLAPLDKKFRYERTVQSLYRQNEAHRELILNTGVLENLENLMKLVDWRRNGYIEIVDLIVPTLEGFDQQRRPGRFEGSIASPINGPLLQAFAREQGKRVSITSLRGINTRLTVRDRNFQSLLEGKAFVTLGEIAAKAGQAPDELKQQAEELMETGLDCIAISDQAHGWAEFQSVDTLVKSGLFRKIHAPSLLHVFAARRKKGLPHVKTLKRKLRRQGIKSLLVVTGDPPAENLNEKPRFTSLDFLPELSKNFFTGAVAHPDPKDIPSMIHKIALGAKFFIVQSTYDRDAWKKWCEEIRKYAIHEKVFILPSVIPVVTKRALQMMQKFPDVPIPKDIAAAFEKLPDDEAVRVKGMELAKEMIREYRSAKLFSGFYIFTKSAKTIRELLKDSVQQTDGEKPTKAAATLQSSPSPAPAASHS